MEALQWRTDVQSCDASFALARKRRAEEELENDQRLAKRFNLLNLGMELLWNSVHSDNLWILLTSSDIEPSGRIYFPVERSPPNGEVHKINDADLMELENTRDKVFIHNLDQELAEIDSEGERLIFLPDIEKKLARIPKSVLTGHSQPVTGNEVVLYNVPSSLSIPPEKDNVRRAILETRARAREKQAQEFREAQIHDEMGSVANGVLYHGGLEEYGNEFTLAATDDDENAMDLG